MTYTLYYSPGACSMAAHIVLEEVAAEFTLELISSRGEREGAMTATEEWRTINPKGRIPAFHPVGGNCGGANSLLTEVPAILYYLARRHPAAGLLPEDEAAVARCVEWMNWLSGNVHAMSYGQIWRAQRFSDDEGALPAIRAKGRQTLNDQYAFIEGLFADGRRWCIPTGYTIVDPYLLVFFQWGQRIGLHMRREFPRWSAVTDRVLQRPAVQRVLAQEGVTIG